MCDFSYSDICYDWFLVVHQSTSVTSHHLHVKCEHAHQYNKNIDVYLNHICLTSVKRAKLNDKMAFPA